MSSKPANQKRRNNEKRKEKSRVAARCRRTKEMQIFSELTAALPAKKEEVEQLDKASVMRLAISYLRARDVVSMLPEISHYCSAPIGYSVMIYGLYHFTNKGLSNAKRIFQFGPVVPEISAFKQTNKQTLQLYIIV
ncbi:hypothetical protein O3G_MSEX007035 [Manduca sexta]|uniref:BHLH domain-containing protein n=1 Tax=Manduca sexta TaxID=7130 RepID=A0A922CMX5_MANSE|nr:hypothetical protein O3G_MSEX007035 [Manduca sexta]KAG6451263.1 hypothetical protein O3G_MSEX007035 [Manduca sexta]